MRIAVISDIHANLEAFRRVLDDLEEQHVHKVICLGDLIGYGPDPNEVVGLAEELQIPCTLGNHELGIIQPEHLESFNDSARISLLITRDLLDQDSMEWLRTLQPVLVKEGGLFVHGCPPDRVTTYLFELTDLELARLFPDIDQTVSFVGHTHDLGAISFDGRGIRHFSLGEGVVPLGTELRYIINVGSVGQPRDGNNHAKYVIWDNVEHEIEVRFVPYDIAKTVRRILDMGLPRINATRLW